MTTVLVFPNLAITIMGSLAILPAILSAMIINTSGMSLAVNISMAVMMKSRATIV